MKKIVIAGYYGFDNAGDELILLSLIDSIRGINAESHITVFSANPAKTRSVYGVSAVNRWNPISLIRVLIGADLMVFGGGGLFQDITSTTSIVYYFSLVLLARIFVRKVVLLGQGIGPITKRANRVLAKFIFAKVDSITVRDEESAEMLKEYSPDGPGVDITADLAYSLDTGKKDRVSGGEKTAFTVGFVLRENRREAEFEKRIEMICRELRSEYGADIVIIPFHIHDDREISDRVSESIGACQTIHWKNPGEIIDAYGRVDVIVGMRLHSLILACLFKKPFMAVPPEKAGCGYDPKIVNFLKSLGLKPEDNTLDGGVERPEDSAKRIWNIFKERESFNRSVLKDVERLIKLSKENIKYL